MQKKIQGYNRIISEITPKRSDKELLNAVVGKAENNMGRKLNKKAVVIPIAAALALACTAGATAAVLNYEALSNIFGGNDNLASEIQTSVFEDSDEHVRVSIDQLLSDGRFAHAAVHYEALDEVGKEWLDNQDFTHDMLGITWNADGEELLVTSGIVEVEEQRTETQRYYYNLLDISSRLWYTEACDGRFTYQLPTEGTKTVDVDLSGTLEFRSFKVVGDEKCNEYLTPTTLEISSLSYALYAHDDYGLVKTEYPESGGNKTYITIPDSEYRSIYMAKFALVLADGKKIPLADGMGGPHENDTYLWQAAEIYDTEQYNNWCVHDFSVEFDFEELVGIEINGVYYDLVEE